MGEFVDALAADAGVGAGYGYAGYASDHDPWETQ